MNELFSMKALVSISAYTVVSINTSTGEVTNVWTSTSQILGIAQDNASTNDSVPIALPGSVAKGICLASIPAGSLVAPETATGFLVAFTSTVTSTVLNKVVGVALTSGSSNSTIDVLIHPSLYIY